MLSMRIAIAGTGGLAYAIAYRILQDTSHQLVLLSRSAKTNPILPCSIVVVDYTKASSVEFAVRGADTVISTVTGTSQIELLKAAVTVRVRRFVAAEFEGLPTFGQSTGILDRGRAAMHQWQQFYADQIQITSFACGILFERFQPGGLVQSRISQAFPLGVQGAYLIDIAKMEANIPCHTDETKGDVMICLTSLRDVARFVTKALEMETWPPVLSMRGQRLGVQELVFMVQKITDQELNRVEWHDVTSLRAHLAYSAMRQDIFQQARLEALLATAQGRYDFINPDLNARFPEIQPMQFRDWFQTVWNLKPRRNPP